MGSIKFTFKGPRPYVGLPDHDISDVEYDRLSLKLQAALDAGIDAYKAVKPEKKDAKSSETPNKGKGE